jgi:hypothetical protein
LFVVPLFDFEPKNANRFINLLSADPICALWGSWAGSELQDRAIEW